MNIAISLIPILSISTALARPSLLGNNIGAPQQPEPEDSQVGTHSISLLRLFLALQIINQASLFLLILTFVFGKSVKRHPTVVNACIVWIIVAIISSLLFYAGKASGSEPSWKLCAIQASLIDGVLPLGSTSILAFTCQLFLNIMKPGVKNSSKVKTAMFIIAPYIAFACFVALGAISASHSPQNVSRDRLFFYCSTGSAFSNVYLIYTAIVLLLAIGFAIAISLYLRRHWKNGEGVAPSDLQLLLRLAIFDIYVIIAFSVSVISLFGPHSPFPELFAASIGPSYAFVLASQPDVYRTWQRLITGKRIRSTIRAAEEKVFSVLSVPVNPVDIEKPLPSIPSSE